MELFSYICLLLLAPICFGPFCDHLQGVPQNKYQKYNRNHIKFIVKFSKILSNGEFYYVYYVISLVLLVYILWNTLKMVTGVTEMCKC
jgi:integral membrane sensor domain MASE1